MQRRQSLTQEATRGRHFRSIRTDAAILSIRLRGVGGASCREGKLESRKGWVRGPLVEALEACQNVPSCTKRCHRGRHHMTSRGCEDEPSGGWVVIL